MKRESLLAAASLWQREMVRFFRQPARVGGAIGTPLLFWLFLGSGLSGSFHMPGAAAGQGGPSYLQYFLPGTILLVVLFTTIFSAISLIQDRSEGFLQGVLVSPAPVWTIIAGKVLGSTCVAVLQGLLFLAAAPLIGLTLTGRSCLAVAGILFLNALVLSTFGVALAWKFKSIQGFHAIMNLVLMPLWFLSGALFPADSAPWILRALVFINPLSHGLFLLRTAMAGELLSHFGAVLGASLIMIVSGGFLLGLSQRMAGAREAGEVLE